MISQIQSYSNDWQCEPFIDACTEYCNDKGKVPVIFRQALGFGFNGDVIQPLNRITIFPIIYRVVLSVKQLQAQHLLQTQVNCPVVTSAAINRFHSR